MAKTSALVALGAIALIVIAALASYAMFFKTSQTIGPQTSTGSGGAGTYISTGATTLRYAISDEITGAAVIADTVTQQGGTGPYEKSITTGSPGDKISVMLNASGAGYHAAYIPSYTVPNAPVSTQTVKMKANGTVTIDIFNTDSVKMTNGGGATNQTATSGATYNLRIRMTGTSNKDTGPMRCILEGEVGVNISRIELTGFGAVKQTVGKPNSYTLLGSGSSVYIYDIDPIVGAAAPEGNLVVISNTAKTLQGSRIKVMCKTKDYFVDSNTGLVVFDIEDSAGTDKSMNSPTNTFYFTP